jgi:hypothetical protein
VIVSEIKRKELKLQGATEVSRLHPDQLQPPELAKLRNGYVGRSDLVPGIRPDFRTSPWSATTRSGDWQGNYAGEPDFVNRLIWSFANDGPVYCSRMWPFRSIGTGTEDLAETYTTGTVATNATDRRLLIGTTTAWLENVWPGCWFGTGSGTGDLHLVIEVDSDTGMRLGSDPGTLSGASYTVFKTWHPDAGLWPVKVERFTTSVIAGPVVPVAPIDANQICGPFVSAMETPELESYAWKKQLVSAAAGQSIYCIRCSDTAGVFESGMPFAVGSNGMILRATDTYEDPDGDDLFVWTKDSDTGSNDFYGVSLIGGSGDNVAVGASGTIYTSLLADPGTWTSRTSGTSDDIYDVVAFRTQAGYTMAVGEGGLILFSKDSGATWEEIESGTTTNLRSVGWVSPDGDDDAYLIIVGDGGLILREAHVESGWDPTDGLTLETIASGTTERLNEVVWDSNAGSTVWTTWMIAGENGTLLVSDDNGATWDEMTSYPGGPNDFNAVVPLLGNAGENTTNIWYIGGDSGELEKSESWLPFVEEDSDTTRHIYSMCYHNDDPIKRVLAGCSGGEVLYAIGEYSVEYGDFETISGLYRAHAFCQAGGFMVYGGMSEWDAEADPDPAWVFKPRRVRWPAPGTIAEFGESGAGWVDLSGTGQILDLCSVGNSVIVGETDRISALTPGASSTWDHRSLAEGLWQLSNMIELNEVAYFVGSDGLLYGATPAGVQRVESGFDLSIAGDWEVASSSPISISYSPSLQALLVMRVADPYKLHLIEPEGGQHAVWVLPEITSGGNTYTPAMVSNLRTSAEDRLIVGYSETTTQSDLLTLELSYGTAVRGLGNIASDNEGRWHMVMQSGVLRLGSVGETVDVKDIEVHTWCGNTTGVEEMDEDPASFTAPDVTVEIRSKEDSSWRSLVELGSVSVGTSSCGGTDTTFSHKIGEGTAGGQTVYSTPCRAAKAVVYTETGGTYTEVTAFTVTDTHEITFTTAPTDGHGVNVFWSGEPVVSTVDSDYVRTTEGLHRITDVDDFETLTLDWYPTTTLDGTIVKAQQMAEGRGILTFGLGAKVEDMELRISIVPRNAANAAAHARIVKLVVSYVGADEETKTDE